MPSADEIVRSDQRSESDYLICEVCHRILSLIWNKINLFTANGEDLSVEKPYLNYLFKIFDLYRELRMNNLSQSQKETLLRNTMHLLSSYEHDYNGTLLDAVPSKHAEQSSEDIKKEANNQFANKESDNNFVNNPSEKLSMEEHTQHLNTFNDPNYPDFFKYNPHSSDNNVIIDDGSSNTNVNYNEKHEIENSYTLPFVWMTKNRVLNDDYNNNLNQILVPGGYVYSNLNTYDNAVHLNENNDFLKMFLDKYNEAPGSYENGKSVRSQIIKLGPDNNLIMSLPLPETICQVNYLHKLETVFQLIHAAYTKQIDCFTEDVPV